MNKQRAILGQNNSQTSNSDSQIIISSAGTTHIGGSNNKENQDCFFLKKDLFGVLDGHGNNGGKMAITACKEFEKSSVEMTFTEMFKNAERKIKKLLPNTGKIPLKFGGTTASIIKIMKNGGCKLGHVGDSEVRYYDSEKNKSLLSEDHSVFNFNEFKRILSTPEPANFYFATSNKEQDNRRPIFVTNDNINWSLNPLGGYFYCNVNREWAGYVYTPKGEGLAVTRALGDFTMKKYGIISEPSIVNLLPPKIGSTRAIVMGSDGMWDVMHDSKIYDIVRHPEIIGNASMATRCIMESTIRETEKVNGNNGDNITVVVIYITIPEYRYIERSKSF